MMRVLPAISAGDHERSRDNNFDLIRLLAAAQVAILHICEHLDIQATTFTRVLGLFPGVPIFFFVSGFLVSQSLSRASGLGSFYRNRVLRVYPALWGCLIVSICLAALFEDLPWTSGSFAIWLVAQATIGQFYNPPFLRDFGVGVINGSLWTIPVELQFYIVLPAIYLLVKRASEFFGGGVLVAVTALAAHTAFLITLYGQGTLTAKLLQVTILPWLFFFMIGALAAWHWSNIIHLFRGKFIQWLILYFAGMAAISHFTPLAIDGNRINGISALLLFGVVLSFAFTVPTTSRRLLGGNDISYGLYLYHMPLVNAYLATDAPHSVLGATLVFVTAIIAALLSWTLVERPALALKARRTGGANAYAREGRA